MQEAISSEQNIQRKNQLLREQAQLYAEYAQAMDQFSQYQEYQTAKSTSNQGERYDSMQGDLSNQKTAFQNGLIGTDDFKKYTADLSEYGFEDVEEFKVLQDKAARYLTEDASGVSNFLQDLKENFMKCLRNFIVFQKKKLKKY